MPRLIVASLSTAFRAGIHSLLGGDPDFHFLPDVQGPLDPVSVGCEECIWVFSSNDTKWLLETRQGQVESARGFLAIGDEDALQALRGLEGLVQHGWGVLPVHASTEALRYGLMAIDQGLMVISPEWVALVGRPAQEKQDMLRPGADEIEPLSEREREVLGLLGQGLANKQIAQRLQLSENTVKFHVSAIYSKLGVNNRTEALRRGAGLGLVAL
jgi:DNA-binding CsgD family transcriptional regulator